MYEFDGDSKKHNALLDYVAFKEIYEFVRNESALKAHAMSYRVFGDTCAFSSEDIEALRSEKVDTLNNALQHFANQTIVSLCTTFEVSVRDYLKALFVKKPMAMYKYLGSDDSRGQVPLKEIVQSASYEELLASLADRASAVASKGKYGAVLGRALSCSGDFSNEPLSKRLDSLQANRNRLVHERHRPSTSFEEVGEVHAIVDEAIEQLCDTGLSIDIPGRYTCINPEYHRVIQNLVSLTQHDV